MSFAAVIVSALPSSTAGVPETLAFVARCARDGNGRRGGQRRAGRAAARQLAGHHHRHEFADAGHHHVCHPRILAAGADAAQQVRRRQVPRGSADGLRHARHRRDRDFRPREERRSGGGSSQAASIRMRRLPSASRSTSIASRLMRLPVSATRPRVCCWPVTCCRRPYSAACPICWRRRGGRGRRQPHRRRLARQRHGNHFRRAVPHLSGPARARRRLRDIGPEHRPGRSSSSPASALSKWVGGSSFEWIRFKFWVTSPDVEFRIRTIFTRTMTRLGLAKLLDVAPEVGWRWRTAYLRLKKRLEITE